MAPSDAYDHHERDLTAFAELAVPLDPLLAPIWGRLVSRVPTRR